MALAATYVDRYEFLAVPWYLIIFIPICPLYPLLLAINFWKFKKSQQFNQPLLHFTVIGSITYGIMAFIFYPLYMAENGFGWYELGNIFWVVLYSAQIIFIFPYLQRIRLSYFVLITSYFFIKHLSDRFGDTYSYQREGSLSPELANLLFMAIVIITIGAIAIVFFKTLQNKLSEKN